MDKQEQPKEFQILIKKRQKQLEKISKKVKTNVTRWGKNYIQPEKMDVRVDFRGHFNTGYPEMYIEIRYPEFGAEMSLKYAVGKPLQYSKGTTGAFTSSGLESKVYILLGKLIENEVELEKGLSQIMRQDYAELKAIEQKMDCYL